MVVICSHSGHRRPPPARPQAATLFYDADCGLCRWAAAVVAVWDRRGAVRLTPLQARPVADLLLGAIDEQTRMASWHLVIADKDVRSAGGGVAPLLRLLPGGAPLAHLATALEPLTSRAYDFVARHRSAFGRLLSHRARSRAEARLRNHEARWKRARGGSRGDRPAPPEAP